MEKRHNKESNKETRVLQKNARRATKNNPAKVDQLGIERGQNAEKGNTHRPENIRDMKEPAH